MKNLGYLETNQSVKLSLKVCFYVKVKTGDFEHHKAGGNERKYKNKWGLQLSGFSPYLWQYVRAQQTNYTKAVKRDQHNMCI